MSFDNNNINIFAIVQSTGSGFLKDSNTTVGVKNLLRWGSKRRPLVYKADVFTIPPTVVKSKGKISQKFVAFSEYMNFIWECTQIISNLWGSFLTHLVCTYLCTLSNVLCPTYHTLLLLWVLRVLFYSVIDIGPNISDFIYESLHWV